MRNITKILTNVRQTTHKAHQNASLRAPDLHFVYQEVRRLTLAAHVALGCRGVSCCGFPLRRPHRGKGPLLLRPTQPGMTETSSVPEPAKTFAGTTFDEARAMDGAGRLARSQRSLGPQADLKAAAIGAVVLLREWLGLRARARQSPSIDREPPNRLILWLERYLPNRPASP